MRKIYHPHVAKVMQRALNVFRRNNAGETVSSICGSKGVELSRANFYFV